jgi:ligand-binding SRPBCC domain-containing protein
MPTLELVFDLARDIDLHATSMQGYTERPIAGVTSGLIGPGESVTWQATHFGLPFRMTSRITAFAAPRHFRDEMVAGPFKRLVHDHLFEAAGTGTLMRDVFDYEAPWAGLGRLADRMFLRRHMVRLLEERTAAIKRAAEAPGRGSAVA